MRGKNQEKVQNPKGNGFSFLFQAALSLWPCVGTAERKLSLQMGSLWLLGRCPQQSCRGVSDTEHCWCHSHGCGISPGPAAPSGLQTLPAAALLWRGHSCCSRAPWGAGQAEDEAPPPLGALGGSWRVRGCSHFPVQSQSQIPADLAAQGNLSAPWLFAFKGSILYQNPLSVCAFSMSLGHRVHSRGTVGQLWESGGQSLSRGAAE